MQFSQLGHTDNTIERCAHIVRQSRKEHITRLGIFTRHPQGMLRHLQALQLLLLFGVHLTEEEDGLVRLKQVVAHQAHIKPFVFPAKALAEFAAEIINMTVHKLLDIITGKGLGKFIGCLRLHIGQ